MILPNNPLDPQNSSPQITLNPNLNNADTDIIKLTWGDVMVRPASTSSNRPNQKLTTQDIMSIPLDDLATNFSKKLKIMEWIQKQFKTYYKNGEQAVANNLQPIFSRAQQDEKLWESLLLYVVLDNPCQPSFIAGVMKKIAPWPNDKLKQETFPQLLAKH